MLNRAAKRHAIGGHAGIQIAAGPTRIGQAQLAVERRQRERGVGERNRAGDGGSRTPGLAAVGRGTEINLPTRAGEGHSQAVVECRHGGSAACGETRRAPGWIVGRVPRRIPDDGQGQQVEAGTQAIGGNIGQHQVVFPNRQGRLTVAGGGGAGVGGLYIVASTGGLAPNHQIATTKPTGEQAAGLFRQAQIAAHGGDGYVGRRTEAGQAASPNFRAAIAQGGGTGGEGQIKIAAGYRQRRVDTT